jgi:hypothetical protein
LRFAVLVLPTEPLGSLNRWLLEFPQFELELKPFELELELFGLGFEPLLR